MSEDAIKAAIADWRKKKELREQKKLEEQKTTQPQTTSSELLILHKDVKSENNQT